MSNGTVSISNIRIGHHRHRRDLGDLASLIESIQNLGLLHPPTINPDSTLIAGHRRLVACQSLGWTEIPVTVVEGLTDALSQLRAERDENICRLAMKPSELVALGLELERLEKPKAIERQKELGKSHGQDPYGKFPEGGATRDIVGQALGWSGRTYGEAKALVQTASDPDESAKVRAIAKRAISEMDDSGKVSPAYRKIAEAKNPELRPKHPSNTPDPTKPPSLKPLDDKPPRKRSAKAALSSLKQAALDVEAVASGFETGVFGDMTFLVDSDDANEWIDLLVDSSRRLRAHLRTLKRYQQVNEQRGTA